MPRKMIASASVALAMMVGAGGSVVLAPAANAAGTHYVTLTCQAPTTIYGDVGDTFIFTMANTCDSFYELYNTLNYDNGPDGFLENNGDRSDWYVYSDGSGTTTITTILLSSNGGSTPLSVGDKVAEVDQDSVATAFDIIYGGSAVADVVDQSPPPVAQAVAMPVSGSCLDVKDADLNWGGAESGNWKPSWQQWVNNGAGGGVCQRTLNYVGAGKWAAS
jgi:hypothetical protein